MALAPESWPAPFHKLIRTFNKYVFNPLTLRVAGRRYWYASVIEHTGRRSGRRYSTPIVVDRVSDQLIIPLPYGIHVDWLNNVLTAGNATVISKGQTYQVFAPEIIDATPLLPPGRRRTYERAGVGRFLRMRVAQ